MSSRFDDYATVATVAGLCYSFIYLVHPAGRPRGVGPWTWRLVRARHRRVRLVAALAFMVATLAIVMVNLWRALVPQAGANTPWVFAIICVPVLVLLVSPSIRYLRRSRRTGSSSSSARTGSPNP